jgi:hypothetical protein
MSRKRTWMRPSVAGARGLRPGPWHLLGADAMPWCGRRFTAVTTTAVQGFDRPAGPVCQRCLRAERRAARAAARQARGRAATASAGVRAAGVST